MPATPESTGHHPATNGDAELECPRCRRPDQRNGNGRRSGRCPVCGLPLIPSVRRSETEAWRQLYGNPPAQLR
jgi:hypothetical protein